MAVVKFKEKWKVLAEEYGWLADSAQGYVEGERCRKLRRAPPQHLVVGIDDFSEGFRAGYFDRQPSSHTQNNAFAYPFASRGDPLSPAAG